MSVAGTYFYVVGRPHSGSTILDILLGNGPEVAGIGQLVSGMGKTADFCACGATIGDCPFWREVRERVAAAGIPWEEAVAASTGQAHVRSFLRTLLARPDDRRLSRLAVITHAIQTALREVSGKPHMLDSSKEPTRALFLAKHCPQVRFLRLVRHPCSSVASHYWRLRDKGYFHFLRKDRLQPALGPLFLILAAASWTIGNLLGEIAMRHARGRVLVLRYEDLRDDPQAALRRIEAAFGLDLSAVIEQVRIGAPLSAGHVIGGNGIRLEHGLRFDAAKERSRPPLPRWLELTTLLLCWPMMGRYGYRSR